MIHYLYHSYSNQAYILNNQLYCSFNMNSLTLSLLILIVQISWIPPGMAKFHKETQIFSPPLPEKSYFGFSATYQPDIRRLIVSAPTADNIGQIFSCDIDNDVCDKINIEIIRVDSRYPHNYWLGATVKAGPDYFLTCAPLTIEMKYYKKFGTFATCFKIVSNESYTLPSISNDDRKRYTEAKIEHKMDSFGWSIDIAKSNNSIFGGPGMFSGRAMIMNPQIATSAKAVIGKEYHVHFNFGYSVVYGFFYNNNIKFENFAIGSPYGIMGNGKVLIFSSTKSGTKVTQVLLERYNSVGSMFGAVLCSARLAADTDALFVGAPTEAQGYDFNMGAVYVYQKVDKDLAVVRVIKGQETGGQLGSSIANIGDMNGDKINDIAISAPYENDGKGVVYLYCGASIVNSDIGSLTPLQRIEASANTKTFGKSLAVLSDHDRNGCNELAIGAPGKGSVVLYKCITEILIKLEAKFPPLKNRADNTRFTFKSCFTVSYPAELTKVIGNVKINLQITHEQAKLVKPDEDSEYIESLLITQTEYCRDVVVSTPVGGNYNHEISYQMTATLTENPEELPYDPHRVMFSDRSKLTKKGSVRAAECTGDNECVPILDLTITALKNLAGPVPYTIGSSSIESFKFTVTNAGDTAYEMCAVVSISEGSVINQTPKGCTNAKNRLICKPLKTLRRNGVMVVEPIDMKMDQLTSKNEEIIIHVDMFDDCNNQTEVHKNSKSLTIPLGTSTNFAIKGYTDIDNVVNMTKDEIKLFGKEISHIYTIANNGPTNWVGLQYTLIFHKELYIDPSVESNYLTSTDSDIKCVVSSNTTEEATVTCNIGMVLGKTQKQIIVPIHILPGKLDSLLEDGNVTAVTECNLDLGHLTARVTTTLTFGKASVPLWIIFAACFVGLLIVILLVLILVECGCMRRKNKEKLQDLKKDVRRQTIRRSMMQTEDRQRLVDATDNEPSCSIDHPEDPTKEVSFHQNTPKESDLQENVQSGRRRNGHPMLRELNERLVQFE